MPATAGSDIRTLRALAPFLWDYRGRVALALACLVLAKVANVGVPLVLKDIVDRLDRPDDVLLVLPLGLLLAYGALKLASTLFNELRDSVFARVRHGAMRRGCRSRCSNTCTGCRCASTWNARPAACRATSSAARAASAR